MLLLCVSSCLFFLRLDCALLEPEEARYAEIPREMLLAGEWIVPQYHGQPYYDKPPLLYWLIMLSYSLFGVSDWSARWVPGLCGVATVLLVYGWGQRVAGRRAGLLGALVLALSFRFIYLGRMVATDALLSLCVTAALACAQIGIMGPGLRWRWWLAAGFACGMGLLAKGPVTLVLVGAPVFAYCLINSRAARSSAVALAAFALVALLAAAPWYVAVMLRDAQFAEYFFWKHHVVRYVAPFDHAKPFWFYLPGFVAGTMPWCLLLAPLFIRLWRARDSFRMRQPPEIVLPLVAAVWCLAFFSASGSKRVGYILPAFAPFALVIGEQIDHLWVRIDERLANRLQPGHGWLTALPLAGSLLGAVAALGLAAFDYMPGAAAIAVAAILLLIAVLLFTRRRQLTPYRTLAFGAAIVLGECLVGVQWVLPQYAERFSLRREVLSALQSTPPDIPVVCHPRGWDSVSFYRQRDDAIVFTVDQRTELLSYLQSHSEVLIFLRDNEASHVLLNELPRSHEFSVRGRQGSTLVGRIQLASPGGYTYKSR